MKHQAVMKGRIAKFFAPFIFESHYYILLYLPQPPSSRPVTSIDAELNELAHLAKRWTSSYCLLKVLLPIDQWIFPEMGVARDSPSSHQTFEVHDYGHLQNQPANGTPQSCANASTYGESTIRRQFHRWCTPGRSWLIYTP